MIIITGAIDFPDLDRAELVGALDEITALSRQDAGCIDYWWAEDVTKPMRFRFFECWESEQHLADHQAQPFEEVFLSTYVARCSGARAHTYAVSDRRSVT